MNDNPSPSKEVSAQPFSGSIHMTGAGYWATAADKKWQNIL